VSSVITEKAPRHIRSHFVQRLRWNRGYLTCLARLARSPLPWKRKLALSLPFLTPISCSLAFLGWMLIAGQWIFEVARGVSIPAVTYSLVPHPIYTTIVSSWATLLFVVGVPLCVFSFVRTLWSLDLKKSTGLALLLPYYWTFIGFAA